MWGGPKNGAINFTWGDLDGKKPLFISLKGRFELEGGG